MDSSLSQMAMLGQLLDEHRDKLLAMLRRRIDPQLNVRLDPEDVLSDACLIAQRKYPAYHESPTISPYAWLYGIARDCLIDAWRRETRDRRDMGRDIPWPAASSAQLAAGLVHTGTSPSEAVERKHVQERIQQTLDLLKEKDREILWMRHFDQLTHKDAGDVLGISESAATLRYVRALERLRKLWKQLYGELETS